MIKQNTATEPDDVSETAVTDKFHAKNKTMILKDDNRIYSNKSDKQVEVHISERINTLSYR